MLRIAIVEDGEEVRSQLLDQRCIHVGRDAANDVVLRDGYISGRHGEIRLTDGGVVYEDLRTTNGSMRRRNGEILPVDERRLHQVSLEDGDELLLGDAGHPLVVRVSVVSDLAPATFIPDELLEGTNLDVTRAGTVGELSQHFDRQALLALHQLSTRLSGRLAQEELLETFADCVLQVFQSANHVAVYLLNDKTGEFGTAFQTARDGDTAERPISRTIRDQVLACGRALTFADGDEEFDASESLHEFNVRAGLAAPLWNGRRIIGMVQVDRRGLVADAFGRRDLEVLAVFAHQAAMALENARLHEGLQAAVEKSICGLVRALEAKDRYTSGHSEAVGELSRHLAVRMGLPPHEVQTVARAAVLHDIGKIGIPYHVLNKEGRLTAEEFGLLRSHPDVGARILEPFDFLSDLLPIVLHHHERWDGKGYPSELAGEDIPLGARILAVVDTYHSLIPDRAYRPGVGVAAAAAELQRCSGTQFDANVVEVLMDMLRELGEIDDEAEGEEVVPAATDARPVGAA